MPGQPPVRPGSCPETDAETVPGSDLETDGSAPDMDLVWLTYDELADRLGIERESARQQVKRRRWARRPGNDGKVRVGVPEEVLGARSEPGTERATNPAHAPGHDPAQIPAVMAVLSRHIERLEAEIEALKQER